MLYLVVGFWYNNSMDKKLEGLLKEYSPISTRYLALEEYLASPEIIADNRAYLRYAEEKNSLEESYKLGEALKVAIELEDEREISALYACLSQELLPKGIKDERGAVVELRAENPQSQGLLEELTELYLSYGKAMGYKANVCEKEDRFVSLSLEGKGAYFKLKGETGTHHATGGKIGNSNVWVSVTPIVEDVNVILNEKEVRTDIFHSSGAGGQNINKVATAVRLTHVPTGIVVTCKEERSQLQNRNRAKVVLLSRLLNYYREKELGDARKERASAHSKSRTQRVRNYDYDREIATDLRLNLNLPIKVLKSAGLDEFITPLLVKESKN